jgi:hypothetical protein
LDDGLAGRATQYTLNCEAVPESFLRELPQLQVIGIAGKSGGQRQR